ncbi:hypothetical protein RHMOL_Rhmol13G0213500 [Rhododendron molle]|uniref:Uncharacterized protein n=1 Tax=Rhododendron molle TaxID=49168 RepID=A0ACC0L8Y9_RHOML|nr:hypothetical protein RHMOL_Rhmol13G0213500 [Rhododendron molle]
MVIPIEVTTLREEGLVAIVAEDGVLRWCTMVMVMVIGAKGGVSSQVIIFVVVPIGVSILLFVVGFCFVTRRAKKKCNFVKEANGGDDISTVQSLQYDFDQQEQILDWSRRYKIIDGIARGMLYLHDDSQLRIIHRDLKASNILLDGDMNAKISDFGMAQILRVDQTQGNASEITGTFGYMSPEYAMHGQFSTLSDVFSFGVLILEITTGMKNNIFCQSDIAPDLLSYAWKFWNDGAPLHLMDPLQKGPYSKDEVIKCTHIALLCVQDDPRARPSMATVVAMLDGYFSILSLPQQPAFRGWSRTGLELDSSWSKPLEWSVNEVSISELEPR